MRTEKEIKERLEKTEIKMNKCNSTNFWIYQGVVHALKWVLDEELEK